MTNPILHNIVSAYTHFVGEYTKFSNNYKIIPLVDNPAFKRGPMENRLLDCTFFGNAYYKSNSPRLRALTVGDCFIEDNFRSVVEFAQLDLHFTQATWMRLRSSILYTKNKLHEPSPVYSRPLSLSSYLDSFKKGSKKFRKILDNEQICNTDLSSLVSVNSFAGITNTPIPENEDLVYILGSWNMSFLPNTFREFIFLCRNNQL
jgi:hypothetical protein